ncbi:cupin domain-containing protein [Pseudomarimonas salicorniae]|uniref:Cupin domain-containing protein n=1 Tax=Pseudomarimonas salicorniae TaxID=2933270 RepID=A0ABT0GDJ7_9GAMM|nr:cupin domain-containing protein [Lysobacter sp. CAU 1642]MCK7592229.1 cupin domain-containing protein [Lysobacter sp. CAU 1642]
MSGLPAARSAADGGAPHYRWGGVCEGWRLLDGEDLSVIEEAVPPGAGERRHLHARARQCFYVLSGCALIEFDDGAVELVAGQSLEVPPGIAHRFHNPGDLPVRFLVISAPATRGDREDL